ncbi:MAG: hypothetical protein HKN56_02775 [Gammaproteobacteria bacterium]|nr:hypothetical protein [Gammaproteobacteria bacterium]
MRRELSTRFTFMYRWVISGVLTVLAVTLVLYVSWPTGIADRTPVAIAASVVIAALMMLLARAYDRAKRVWLDSDTLIINDYNRTIEVPVAELESVGQLFLFGPERISLHFKRPTVFGSKIMFFAPLRWPARSPHPLAEELRALAATHSA